MARTWTAVSGVPAGTTICTRDGTCCRSSDAGITYVRAEHVAEVTARTDYTIATATATQMGAAGVNHRGRPLSWSAENG